MLNTERVCERLRRQDNREFFSQPNPRLLLVFFFYSLGILRAPHFYMHTLNVLLNAFAESLETRFTDHEE